MLEPKKLEVTLIRSMCGRLKRHQACVRGLGIRRLPPDRESAGHAGESRYDK